METIKLVEFHPDTPYIDDVVRIFLKVHDGIFTSTKERFERHGTYDGYLGLVAVDGQDRVLGFVYGYTSLPDQFYNGKLRANMTEEQVGEWLSDCFEFVELAVDPEQHRNGIGKKLHDAILEKAPHKTSVLTTGLEMEAAQALYNRSGWETIQADVDVLNVGNRQLIMGKRLR